jgi:Zn-dependent peptidase ImmA (M78 family)/DNA-binding XRE family transcriptional regulator
VPTEALISHQVLRWARERRRISVREAADRLGVEPDRWTAWEEGTERPTFRQAQSVARALNVTFGYLFLPEPPTHELDLPDLRTVAGQLPVIPSPELTDVVNDALRKQRWYREYLEDEGAQPVPFIGRFSSEDDWDTIASDMRRTLGVNMDLRRQASDWEDFLRRLIARVEDAGVLVLRNSVVGSNNYRALDVDEFRGFVISDAIAPLIFINSRDSLSAQVFTLAHELAHLWLGSTGISNPNYRRTFSEQSNLTERACNYIAAETLLPHQELITHWNDQTDIAWNLSSLSRRYRVSMLVVLRRAYDLMKIPQDEYRSLYAMFYSRRSRTRDDGQSSGGGNFYTQLITKNSRAFTSTVITALEEGRVLHRDAARLLGVHFGRLEDIYNHLTGGQIGA